MIRSARRPTEGGHSGTARASENAGYSAFDHIWYPSLAAERIGVALGSNILLVTSRHRMSNWGPRRPVPHAESHEWTSRCS
jgi:hypothetical protein